MGDFGERLDQPRNARTGLGIEMRPIAGVRYLPMIVENSSSFRRPPKPGDRRSMSDSRVREAVMELEFWPDGGDANRLGGNRSR